MSESRQGLAAGVAAYSLWGLFPLYWPLLEPAGAFELLAHRITWAAVTMALVTIGLRRREVLVRLVRDRRTAVYLSVAAVVITANWATYIWAVTHSRVVEASLGYFINPLVTVLMGVLILKERLRPWQWVALGVGTAAVVVLAVDYGRPPWVALVLACSFGTYGLAKKQAGAPAIESLTLECALLAPFALLFLGVLAEKGTADFGHHGLAQMLLIASSGVVTGIPLVLFSAAATRVSMVALGLLQYLAPILQFALGVFWFHEAMPTGRWLGFVLVWLALALFTVESVRHRRRSLQLVVESSSL